MAVILGIRDPDSARRAFVRARLPDSLSGLPHLKRQQTTVAGLDVIWDAPPSTPISEAKDKVFGLERFAWVVGDFDAPYSVNSDAAPRLLKRTAHETPDFSCISGQNGYYLAMLYEGESRLVLGTDVFGLFPLYYWSRGDVFLFGTSPELFKLHPLFVAEPSLYGVASVLLVNHISGGQSLFQDVRRCNPGSFIEWTPVRGVREAEANPLRMSDSGFDLPYTEFRDRVSACLDEFHGSLARLPNLNLSLSGGQDSRTLAGYLSKYMPSNAVCAVSLGKKTDMELSYALKVSRLYGWRHRYADVGFENFPTSANCQLRLESMQGPFASFEMGTIVSILANIDAPVISGYFGDPVIGDGQILGALSPQTGEFEFSRVLKKFRRYGFSREEVVDLLLSQDGPSIVGSVIDELQKQWNLIDGKLFQKAWLFSMTNRVRFHIGAIIWRMSLGAWPLLPYVDRRLLEIVASMPMNYFADRRIQADIIKRDFPELALLPLDRNDRRPGYLVKPWHRKVRDHLPGFWRLERALSQHGEHRYYYRIYDFNSPGWKLVREEAEQFRSASSSLLSPSSVAKHLPKPCTVAAFEDQIMDASKVKTLAGLLLWNGKNFVEKH